MPVPLPVLSDSTNTKPQTVLLPRKTLPVLLHSSMTIITGLAALPQVLLPLLRVFTLEESTQYTPVLPSSECRASRLARVVSNTVDQRSVPGRSCWSTIVSDMALPLQFRLP